MRGCAADGPPPLASTSIGVASHIAVVAALPLHVTGARGVRGELWLLEWSHVAGRLQSHSVTAALSALQPLASQSVTGGFSALCVT